jgi:hypothetical protein
MEDQAFRRFLKRWFLQLGLWETPFTNSGSETARDCGKLEAALMIWNSLSRSQQARLIMEENDGNAAK